MKFFLGGLFSSKAAVKETKQSVDKLKVDFNEKVQEYFIDLAICLHNSLKKGSGCWEENVKLMELVHKQFLLEPTDFLDQFKEKIRKVSNEPKDKLSVKKICEISKRLNVMGYSNDTANVIFAIQQGKDARFSSRFVKEGIFEFMKLVIVENMPDNNMKDQYAKNLNREILSHKNAYCFYGGLAQLLMLPVGTLAMIRFAIAVATLNIPLIVTAGAIVSAVYMLTVVSMWLSNENSSKLAITKGNLSLFEELRRQIPQSSEADASDELSLVHPELNASFSCQA